MKAQLQSVGRVMTMALFVSAMTSGTIGAPFVNLGLDQPILDNASEIESGHFVGPASDLLNGWELRLEHDTRELVMFVSTMMFFGYSPAELHPSSVYSYDPVVREGFTLSLVTANQAGVVYEGIRLSQVGDIPTEADLLRMFVPGAGADQFTIRIDGVEAPYAPDPQVPFYTLVDVSPWKGRTARIEFDLQKTTSHSFPASMSLDILGFERVPEPGAAMLLLAGGGWLFLTRRRRSWREPNSSEPGHPRLNGK